MKKIFTFAAIAAISLPLMMSCKSKNDPTDPNSYANLTPEERLDDWVSPDEEAAVPITVENVIGYWKLAYWAEVRPGETAPSFERDYEHFSANYTESYYMSLDRTMKSTTYEIDTVFTYDYDPLTATLAEEQLCRMPCLVEYQSDWKLNGDVYMNGSDTMKISVLEKERMVLKSGVTSAGGGATYRVYKRLQALPAFPRTMTDRLIQNAWRVTVDSMIISKFSLSITEGNEILKIEANRLPANTILKFIKNDKNDGGSNGEVVISEGTVANEKARYQCSLGGSSKNSVDVNFHFPDDMPYALPAYLEFRPSSKEGKARLLYETFDATSCTTYKYFIEAVN